MQGPIWGCHGREIWLSLLMHLHCITSARMAQTFFCRHVWVRLRMAGPADVDKISTEFCIKTDSDVLVLMWHRSWSRVSRNVSGVTGWATVVRSLRGEIPEQSVVRTVGTETNP